MYVFGYGSLIWNPGFEFQTSELAEIIKLRDLAYGGWGGGLMANNKLDLY